MLYRLALLSCLLPATAALAQAPPPARPLLEYAGDHGLQIPLEHVIWYKHLDDDRLVLVGGRTYQVLDFKRGRVVESRPVTLPTLETHSRIDPAAEWVVGPDGRKLLVVGHREARDATKEREAGWVWDLETGKRAATLDRGTGRVRSGLWSRNGQTLVTFDQRAPVQFSLKLGVSFWDGQSFEHRATLALDNVTWTYLSADGRRFFAATGKAKRFLGLKYVSDAGGIIRVWETATGRLEKTISVGERDFNPKTEEITISPDERLLVFNQKHKSKPAEHRLMVWEIDGGVEPKYEVKANPEIKDSSVVFSPDSQYFALDAGKTLQIYEARTGAKRAELLIGELPLAWLADNGVLLVDDWDRGFSKPSRRLEAFDAATGRALYQHKVVYDVSTTYDTSYDNAGFNTTTEVRDDTTTVPHPSGRLFLTYSKQFVKVFDSRTGELLQTVFAPSIDYSHVPPRVQRGGEELLRAGWSKDGRTLYILNGNRQTVELWSLP